MFGLLRKIRNAKGEDLIRFIEDWYRIIVAIILLWYLGFRWFQYNVHYLPFALIIYSYCIYSLIVHILKARPSYSIDRYRLIRTIFDIIFPLLLIIFNHGVRSPAFALLVIPVFFGGITESCGWTDRESGVSLRF